MRLVTQESSLAGSIGTHEIHHVSQLEPSADVWILGPTDWAQLEALRAEGHRIPAIVIAPAAPEGRFRLEPLVCIDTLDALDDALRWLSHGREVRQVELGFGRLDLHRSQLIFSRRSVRLTPLQCRIVAYLAARVGRPVPRDELLRQVWGYRGGVRTNAVEMAMSRLRKKLSTLTGSEVLVNERGHGYRLITRPDRGFVGRRRWMAEAFLRLREHGSVRLYGPPGVGCSTLARALAEDFDLAVVPIEAPKSIDDLYTAIAQHWGWRVPDTPATLWEWVTLADCAGVVLDGLDGLTSADWLAFTGASEGRFVVGVGGMGDLEVPALGDDEARQVIHGLALQRGLALDPQLLTTLVDATSGIPGRMEILVAQLHTTGRIGETTDTDVRDWVDARLRQLDPDAGRWHARIGLCDDTTTEEVPVASARMLLDEGLVRRRGSILEVPQALRTLPEPRDLVSWVGGFASEVVSGLDGEDPQASADVMKRRARAIRTAFDAVTSGEGPPDAGVVELRERLAEWFEGGDARRSVADSGYAACTGDAHAAFVLGRANRGRDVARTKQAFTEARTAKEPRIRAEASVSLARNELMARGWGGVSKIIETFDTTSWPERWRIIAAVLEREADAALHGSTGLADVHLDAAERLAELGAHDQAAHQVVLANVHLAERDPRRSVTALQRASTWVGNSSPRSRLNVAIALGSALGGVGEFDAGLEQFEHALTLARRTEPVRVVQVRHQRAWLRANRADLDGAREDYLASLAFQRTRGPHGVAAVLASLADLDLQAERLDLARIQLEEAAQLQVAPFITAVVTLGLATTDLLEGAVETGYARLAGLDPAVMPGLSGASWALRGWAASLELGHDPGPFTAHLGTISGRSPRHDAIRELRRALEGGALPRVHDADSRIDQRVLLALR